MKHIVFDFDGVICNSAMELLYNAYSAFLKYNPGTALFDGRTFSITAEDMEFLGRHPDFKKFTDYVPFTRNGMDLPIALEDMMQGRSADDKNRFFAFADSDQDKLQAYHDLFYAKRTETMTESYDQWMMLFELISEMDAVVKQLAAHPDTRLYISTTKSKDAVSNLLELYHLSDCFKKVLTKEDLIESKNEHFERLMKDTDPEDQWYFIEDSLKNIEQVAARYKERVQPVFVEWGYASEREKSAVRSRGITTVKAKHRLKDAVGC